MNCERDSNNVGESKGVTWPAKVSAVDDRRSFLAALIGLGSVGVGALLAVPLARFSLDPLLKSTTIDVWSDVGSIAEFADLSEPLKRIVKVERVDGWRKIISENAVYIVKAASGGKPRVFSTICPHLGCGVAWHADKQQFVSPCHNARFGPDGSLLAGPARRGLDELDVRIEGEQLLVLYRYFRPLVAYKEIVG